MWNFNEWARSLNEGAVRNARSAATECSRRRLEREEVQIFLAGLSGLPVSAPTATPARRRHPA